MIDPREVVHPWLLWMSGLAPDVPIKIRLVTNTSEPEPRRQSRHLLIVDWCPECQARTDQELDGNALQVRCTVCPWESTVTERYATEMMQE
jgi:hypothetical protein